MIEFRSKQKVAQRDATADCDEQSQTIIGRQMYPVHNFATTQPALSLCTCTRRHSALLMKHLSHISRATSCFEYYSLSSSRHTSKKILVSVVIAPLAQSRGFACHDGLVYVCVIFWQLTHLILELTATYRIAYPAGLRSCPLRDSRTNERANE